MVNATQKMLVAGQLPQLAREAGNIIMGVRKSGDLGMVEKFTYGKKSPYTRADIAANQFLVPRLEALIPGVRVVSEENPEKDNLAIIARDDAYWLIDPLDGTKNFIKGRDTFAVNIALVDHGEPVLGAVYYPARDEMYYTGADGKAYKQVGELPPRVITVREQGVLPLVAVGYPDKDAEFAAMGVAEMVKQRAPLVDSNARRICLVAEGACDFAAGARSTSTWDTAGPDAVLRAAGGVLCNMVTKQPMRYGRDAVVESGGEVFPCANPPYMAGERVALVKNFAMVSQENDKQRRLG